MKFLYISKQYTTLVCIISIWTITCAQNTQGNTTDDATVETAESLFTDDLAFTVKIDPCETVFAEQFYYRSNCTLHDPIEMPHKGKGKGKQLQKPIDIIVIHDTHLEDEPPCWFGNCCVVVKEVQNKFQNLGKRDLPFHYLIDNFGTIYEGIGWDRIGGHVPQISHKSYGIAVIGEMTRFTEYALEKLLKCGKSLGCVANDFGIFTHKDLPQATSSCPREDIQTFVEQLPEYEPVLEH